MIRVKLALQNELEALERQAHQDMVKGFLTKIQEKFPSVNSVTYYQTSWCHIALYKINHLDLTDLDEVAVGDDFKTAAVELDLKVEELVLIISLLEREDILTHVQRADAHNSTSQGREIVFSLN